MQVKEATYQRTCYDRVVKVKYALLELGAVDIFKVLILKNRDVSICMPTFGGRQWDKTYVREMLGSLNLRTLRLVSPPRLVQ